MPNASSGTRIAGLGHYAPEHRVPNAEIEARLALEAGWIERRTGILERRYAAPHEALTDIAAKAGEMALAASQIHRDSVALTLLATSTPDHLLPPSAPLLAFRLGLARSGGIDLAGACAGFVYALALADSFVRLHEAPVLVVAANILSRRINAADRGSSILFADAAGAVLLVPDRDATRGLLAARLTADGAGYDLIRIPAGGSRRPFSPALALEDVLMEISDGKAVFQQAVGMMAGTAREALARAAINVADVAHFVPHQANSRIMEAARRQIGIPESRTLSSVARFANSSAATIPFTLSLCAAERAYRSGDVLLLSAAGAGLTGGSLVYRW